MIRVNILNERPEEATGEYAKEDCSIATGMGKYIPVQTNREITGEVLIEISDKTIPGLVLPEIVFLRFKYFYFLYRLYNFLV